MSNPNNHLQPSPPPLITRITTYDTTISQSIHSLLSPIIPHSLLKLLELTGDGRLWFPLSISLILSPLSLHSPHLYALSLSLLLGLILDIALIGLLKHLVRRPRPVYNSPMGPTFAVDHWSFPSGHASRVIFVAALFDLSAFDVGEGINELWVWHREVIERWVGERVTVEVVVGCVWVWAVSTAVSRVLMGRHFVVDVAAGCFVGVVNALFVYRFLRF